MGAGSGGAGNSSTTGSDTEPEVYSRWKDEWADCRATLTRFDGYLDPLRKQGFSFVSALLTVAGLVSTVSSTSLTPWAKVAILAVTEGLIVVLGFLEMDYRLMERGAAARARILEARLNLAETDTMAYYYRKEGLWRTDLFLNMGFVALTAGLGAAILIPSKGLVSPLNWPFIALAITSGVSFGLIYYASRMTRTGGLDFGVDRLLASAGETVTFTVTNLYGISYEPPPPEAGFRVRSRQAKMGSSSPTNPTQAGLSSDPDQPKIEAITTGGSKAHPTHAFGFELSYTWIPPLKLKVSKSAKSHEEHGSVESEPAKPKEGGSAVKVPFPDQRPLGEFDAVTWIWDTKGEDPGIYHWTLKWHYPPVEVTWLGKKRTPLSENWVDVAIIETPDKSKGSSSAEPGVVVVRAKPDGADGPYVSRSDDD